MRLLGHNHYFTFYIADDGIWPRWLSCNDQFDRNYRPRI